MIEINLLPSNLRVKKKDSMSLPSFPIIPIAAGIIIVLVAIQILLWLFVQVKSISRDSLKKKIVSLATSNKEAMGIDSKIKEISSKLDIVDKLSGSRFNVSRKLNDLSDSMVSGVWLRKINIKREQPANEPGVTRELLVIEGSSVALGQSGEGAIGRFVNSLKDNKSFSSDFDDIELTKKELEKVQNTEIMDFVIICHFKKGKGL